LYGPPPGIVPGGANPNYAPDASYGGTISPPQNNPAQKSYKDWNTSYPQNSWELTENGIYTQASYIRMLSKFVEKTPCPTHLTINVPSVATQTEKATEQIKANNLINPTNTTFQAGKSILLENGFETLSNTVFKAEISGCN